jgi:hypothetical protein
MAENNNNNKSTNSVICVISGRIYKLAVIDKDCAELRKVYDKIIDEVLCDYPDYRFKDVINVEEIVMLLITKGIGYLLEEPYQLGCPVKTFTNIFYIDCRENERNFSWFELKEETTIYEFISYDIDFFIHESELILKDSFDIIPYEPTIPREDEWICMNYKRPEDFDELVEPYSETGSGLINITKPVLVYYGGKFYIDKRRQFKGFKDWIWNNLEGVHGYNDTAETYWKFLNPPVEENP